MSQVERYREQRLPEEMPLELRGDWLYIGKLARATARTPLAGKWKDDPDGIFCCYWIAHTLGLAVNPMVLKKFHNIDGQIEPAAQTRLGLMHDAGARTRWGRHDDELAELFVIAPDDSEEQRFTWTVEKARAAHLLDEWVELWTDTGQVWEDTGRPKKAMVKYVLGSTTDEYRPEWVQAEIDAGHVKRREPWFGYREDMLMNRCCSMACKFATPEVELGIEHGQSTPAPPPALLDEAPLPGQLERAEARMVGPDDDDGRPFE